MNTEKRQHPRVESLNLMAYICRDENGNVSSQGMGRTLNVSETGVLLETYYPIECEDILLMDIGIQDELIDLKGKVIHSGINQEGKSETGIEFVEVDEKSMTILKKFIGAFRELYE